MKNSNNAKTIEMVQNHMVRMVGGKKKLYELISYYTKLNNGSVSKGILEMLEAPYFLYQYSKITPFLNRIGYTKAQLKKMDVVKQGELYAHLLVRDGTRFYNQYKKELALKKRK